MNTEKRQTTKISRQLAAVAYAQTATKNTHTQSQIDKSQIDIGQNDNSVSKRGRENSSGRACNSARNLSAALVLSVYDGDTCI